MATATGSYATTAALKSRLGISDTSDDTVLGTICDQVNQYIETKTRRVLAPVAPATYLIDIERTSDRFHFPRGVRAISALSVADYTGATRTALVSGEWFIRPAEHERLPGWPGLWVVLSDRATTRRVFPAGYEIVSMTATTGWAAIPDDITDVALTAATRAWHAVKNGHADLVGTDEMGQVLVSRFFSPRDLETLRTYSVDIPA